MCIKKVLKCHEAGLAGTIKVNGEPIVIKGTTTLAALVSSLEEKLGSGAQVEYKDGRFNITGLTGNVKIEGVEGEITDADGSIIKKNPDQVIWPELPFFIISRLRKVRLSF